jgi:hypothetical protein
LCIIRNSPQLCHIRLLQHGATMTTANLAGLWLLPRSAGQVLITVPGVVASCARNSHRRRAMCMLKRITTFIESIKLPEF